MTIRNMPSIGINELSVNDPATEVIKDSLALTTSGVAAMSGCTTTDTMVHNAGNLLQVKLSGSLVRPQLYTNTEVTAQKRITVKLYNKVINFMKGAADDEATQAGDINAGIVLVLGCGAHLSKKVSGSQPDFGVTGSGVGWVKIHARKAVEGAEAHIFRLCIVAAKNTLPSKGDCVDFVSLEGTIEVSGLPSGTVLAINHTSILPVSHTKPKS
ncbi:MAG: hypothetical protein ABR968_09455, partial [Bacteroidales bacterium]